MRAARGCATLLGELTLYTDPTSKAVPYTTQVLGLLIQVKKNKAYSSQHTAQVRSVIVFFARVLHLFILYLFKVQRKEPSAPGTLSRALV